MRLLTWQACNEYCYEISGKKWRLFYWTDLFKLPVYGFHSIILNRLLINQLCTTLLTEANMRIAGGTADFNSKGILEDHHFVQFNWT